MHKHSEQHQNQAQTYQQLLSHKKLSYFILYSVSYMFFGQLYTALGPMFPYLAAIEGRLETQYSFLFTCRAIGFVAGSLSVRFLSHKMTLHHFAALGISFMSVFSILFYFTESLEYRGMLVSLSAIGCSYQDIILNLSALRCFAGDNAAMWLQMLHGFFGIGGLIGPLVVYLFEMMALSVIGALSLTTVVFYLYFSSPENGENGQQNQQMEQKISPEERIPQSSIYILAAAFFFTVGQETTYGGWVSSYAVLYKFSEKQHSTLYSSLYWISITFFRFFFAFLQGSSTRKVETLGIIGAITGFSSYFLIFNFHPQFGLYFMSILLGLCNSVLYALLLTIPQQFGYKLTVKQTTSFVIWASLGQGTLAVLIGKLMGWFSYNWLIYGMVLMDLVIVGLMRTNKQIMVTEKERRREKERESGLRNELLGTEMIRMGTGRGKIMREIEQF